MSADVSAGRPTPWPTVLLIVGAGVVSAFQVGKAPAALAAIQADLGLDLATASWLLSAFALVGALTGVAVGIAVDQVGARRMVLGGLVLQGLCAALGALAEGAPLLLASRAVEGVGFLAAVVAAPTLIVGIARPADLGRAMAVWGTFMPVGIAVVMIAAPLLAGVGWRGFWLANAALLIGYAVLLAVATQPTTQGVPRAAAAPRGVVRDLRQVTAAGGPWLLAALMAAFAAAYFAVFGFLPTILSGSLAVAPETGSLLAAFAVAVNVLGNLACGPLLARGVPRAVLLIVGFATMMLAGFGILGGGLSAPLAYGLCVVFSAVAGLIPVALLDAAPRYAPRPELTGATVGFLMQGNSVGLLVGPAVSGSLAAAFGWSSVALFIAALAVAALAMTMVLRARPVETVFERE